MARTCSAEYTSVYHQYKWFTQFQRWFLELHMLGSHRQYIGVHPQLLLDQSLPASGTCFRLGVHKPKSGGKLKVLPENHQGNSHNHSLTARNVPSYLQALFSSLPLTYFSAYFENSQIIWTTSLKYSQDAWERFISLPVQQKTYHLLGARAPRQMHDLPTAAFLHQLPTEFTV